MGYPRSEVREALGLARKAGQDCRGLHADAPDTAITLERWGFLPIDQAAVDQRVSDWYSSQGLATRTTGKSKATQNVAVVSDPVASPTESAMAAAEAALAAAQAALVLARSMSTPAA